MSKDHIPSDFARQSGYKSDLENAETGKGVKSINTSFGSKNHNAYIMRTDGTHEHFYYSPKTQKSGWHGANYETKNNHPNRQLQKEGDGKNMKTNDFLESIKADKATLDRLNDVSRNAAKITQTQNNSIDNGGRERADSGPMSHGRESGFKGEPAQASQGTENGGRTSSSGHSSEGAGSGGGHSSGGQGSGGQGSGGQGGH